MLNALNAENVLDKGGNGLTLENLVSMNRISSSTSAQTALVPPMPTRWSS